MTHYDTAPVAHRFKPAVEMPTGARLHEPAALMSEEATAGAGQYLFEEQ
ncbi:MAG: hypothetical protein L0229_29685 [Blastocatellia bacterium]|nr:hypothetical protein [Blastocatellia bacterium]